MISKRNARIKLIEIGVMSACQHISDVVGAGDPLNGDQTEVISALFALRLDEFNGNLDKNEIAKAEEKIDWGLL